MKGICDVSLFSMPMVIVGVKRTLLFIIVMLIVEWIDRDKEHALSLSGLPQWVRFIVLYGLILIMLEFMGHSQSFIYFQF